MNALQELELRELEGVELTEESKERFKIEDIDQLNWAFRKINALKGELDKKRELAAAEIERITMWINEEKKPIEDSINYFEFLIKEYHLKQLEENPKAKTLTTPYGKSESRAFKEEPKLVNNEAALKFVKENNLTEFIKEEVKWGDLKKCLSVANIDDHQMVVDENGQVVPGVEVEPASVNFKVKVN